MSDGIDYKAVVADLRAKRAALDAAIAGLEQWQGLGGEDAPGASTEIRPDPRIESGEIRSDSFFGLSIPDAIRKCFRLSKRPLSLSELTNSLKNGGMLTTATNLMATVSATLQRMKQQSGEVVALGKGQWGLAEWYPGLRKEKIEAIAKPKKSGKRNKTGTATPKTASQSEHPVTKDAPNQSTTPRPTAEQIQRIKELHGEGKKPGEIAKEIGLHHLAVWSILKTKKAA